jgi:copper resistance protein C
MIRRIFAVLAALSIAFVLGSGLASAHSVPTGSVPEDGSSVDQGPERASITFNEALQESFATMTVVGPDGNLWSKGDPKVEGGTVSVAVGELGPTGTYTIAYRVTSADGHPVSGTRSFTLTKAGNGTPGAKADSGKKDDGGLPIWPFIVGAVLLFGAGLAFALRGSGRAKA